MLPCEPQPEEPTVNTSVLHFRKVAFVQTYRVETKLQKDGTLTLRNLPFQAGESVEVLIVVQAASQKNSYPLRGTSLHYTDPIEPVAEEDWEAGE